jgi:hypothetical protein
VKNALAWANKATGGNLGEQVDPGFTLARWLRDNAWVVNR